MKASHISVLVPESGAYAAITRVVPNRIAVNLSSNFHDLSIVQNGSETNNVANPGLLPQHPQGRCRVETSQDFVS